MRCARSEHLPNFRDIQNAVVIASYPALHIDPEGPIANRGYPLKLILNIFWIQAARIAARQRCPRCRPFGRKDSSPTRQIKQDCCFHSMTVGGIRNRIVRLISLENHLLVRRGIETIEHPCRPLVRTTVRVDSHTIREGINRRNIVPIKPPEQKVSHPLPAKVWGDVKAMIGCGQRKFLHPLAGRKAPTGLLRFRDEDSSLDKRKFSG